MTYSLIGFLGAVYHRAPAMKRLLFLIAFIILSNSLFAAEQPCVVANRGHFRIHVGTSGLFGGLGHEHLIEAQKVMGCALIDSNDVAHSSVKLEFPTADIRVIDPREKEKDRTEVQDIITYWNKTCTNAM